MCALLVSCGISHQLPELSIIKSILCNRMQQAEIADNSRQEKILQYHDVHILIIALIHANRAL